jgi:hypothetical protein
MHGDRLTSADVQSLSPDCADAAASSSETIAAAARREDLALAAISCV